MLFEPLSVSFFVVFFCISVVHFVLSLCRRLYEDISRRLESCISEQVFIPLLLLQLFKHLNTLQSEWIIRLNMQMRNQYTMKWSNRKKNNRNVVSVAENKNRQQITHSVGYIQRKLRNSCASTCECTLCISITHWAFLWCGVFISAFDESDFFNISGIPVALSSIVATKLMWHCRGFPVWFRVVAFYSISEEPPSCRLGDFWINNLCREATLFFEKEAQVFRKKPL